MAHTNNTINIYFHCSNHDGEYVRKWDGELIPLIHRAQTCPQCGTETGKLVRVRYVDKDGQEQKLYPIIHEEVNTSKGWQGMSDADTIQDFLGLGIGDAVIVDKSSLWFDYYTLRDK